MDLHLLFAWSWITLGLAVGAGLGLFWATDDWLGGYASWPRRLIRLGHVALVGTGLINLAAHWTLAQVGPEPAIATLVRGLFVASAILMPLTCFVAAFHRVARHAFVLPVVTMIGGSIALLHTITQGG